MKLSESSKKRKSRRLLKEKNKKGCSVKNKNKKKESRLSKEDNLSFKNRSKSLWSSSNSTS